MDGGRWCCSSKFGEVEVFQFSTGGPHPRIGILRDAEPPPRPRLLCAVL